MVPGLERHGGRQAARRSCEADYLLRAVAVPAGRHRVEFRFESAAVRSGLLLSLASLLVVLACFAGSWRLAGGGRAGGA